MFLMCDYTPVYFEAEQSVMQHAAVSFWERADRENSTVLSLFPACDLNRPISSRHHMETTLGLSQPSISSGMSTAGSTLLAWRPILPARAGLRISNI